MEHHYDMDEESKNQERIWQDHVVAAKKLDEQSRKRTNKVGSPEFFFRQIAKI